MNCFEFIYLICDLALNFSLCDFYLRYPDADFEFLLDGDSVCRLSSSEDIISTLGYASVLVEAIPSILHH